MSDSVSTNGYRFQQPGLGKTGQYQMSCIPFVTASIPVNKGGLAPTEVKFPFVSKFVTVINLATGSNQPLRVGFSSLGVTGSSRAAHASHGNDNGFDNYFVLNNGESYTGEFRVTSVYLLGATAPHPDDGVVGGTSCLPLPTTASVIAGMTGINAAALTTNWSGSSGVG